MANLRLCAFIGMLVFSWSVTPVYAELTKVHPDYATCIPKDLPEHPTTPPQKPGEVKSAEAGLNLYFSCHDEWTRVYAILNWEAISKNHRLAWKPNLEYGPDLKFGATNQSSAQEAKPTITARPSQKIKLVWQTSSDAVSCEADGEWEGKKPTAGEENILPLHDGVNTYLLRCFNKDGLKSLAMALAIVKPENTQ